MIKISDENLDVLIEGLTVYKDNGIDDPWVLGDDRIIQPLDVLIELRELRQTQYVVRH